MSGTPDVLIVGGGVIGLTTAYYLGRAGARVVVLDQGEPGREASWAGAGIIPPGNPERAADPLARLRAVSAAAFPGLTDELREATGLDNGYRRCGGIEFFAAADDAPADAGRDEGVTFEALAPEALRALEPAVGQVPPAAFHLPGTAQLRNPWHVRALAAACEGLGVRIRPHEPVVGFGLRHGRVVAAVPPNKPRAAGQFLVTAGAWTDRVLAPAGRRLGVRPVRGQIVLYHADRPLFRPVLEVGKRYLVPRDDGRILVGSTEEDVGFDKSTTVDAIAGLKRFACQTVPALAEVAVETTWAGLRPASRDGVPLLGPVPDVGNLFVAAGHFRAGIQLSPATGMAMADLLLGRSPVVDLGPFTPGRPA